MHFEMKIEEKDILFLAQTAVGTLQKVKEDVGGTAEID